MNKRFVLFLLLMTGVRVFGMEEIVIEDDAVDIYASIGTQILLGVIFIAPPVAIGSLFALMRFDKAHKAFLHDEIIKIDKEIDTLRDETLEIEINQEAQRLYEKIAKLQREYEGV